MRLEKCYISGFGRLKDMEFDFKPGLNEILEENGWGKTTFAVFIKAMFYGLIYSPRRKTLTEREHYMPWDQTAFGGSLTFTCESGTYRIERTFGKKESDDTFHLFDLSTGLESDAYSRDIGQELFGLDRDSFEKSIFVPQAAPETEMTDSLNAKMGGLSEVRDDINSFEQAINRLEDARKSYTRPSKTNPGSLTKIREEIRKKRAIVEEIPVLTEAYEQKKDQLKKREAELMSLQWEKAKLTQDIAERSRMEQALGAYHEKTAQMKKDHEELSDLDDFFVRGIPSREEEAGADELEAGLAIARASLGDHRDKLPPIGEQDRLTRLFADSMPTEEDLSQYQKRADRLGELRLQSQRSALSEEEAKDLQDLTEYFRAGKPTAEELTLIQEKEQEKQQLLGQRKALEENYQNKKEKTGRPAAFKGLRSLLTALAFIFLAGGIIFFFALGRQEGRGIAIACLAIALVLFLSRLLFGHQIRRRLKDQKIRTEKEEEDYKSRIEEIRESVEQAEKLEKRFMERYPGEADQILDRVREVQRKYDRYVTLQEREKDKLSASENVLDQLSEEQLSLYTELQHYAGAYGMNLFHDACERELLSRMAADRSEKLALDQNRKEIRDLEESVRGKQERLTAYLSRFPFSPEMEKATDKEKLAEIRRHRERYVFLTEQTEKLSKEIRDMKEQFPSMGEDPAENSSPEDKNGQTGQKNLQSAPLSSVEEMQEKQAAMDQEIAELNRFIQKDLEKVNEASEVLVNHEDEKDRLADDLEEEKRLGERLTVISRTKGYLEAARKRFLSRYMEPLQDGMQTYLREMFPEDEIRVSEDEFELDMDLSIHFRHRGQTRSSAYLSSGYRDLTALAARLALVDTLYQKEQPILILDDPFTNLDADKVRAGLELLKKLGDKRQILYFTCHESRI
ncbi:MAG: AAA family ATPase [Lachnospiraceae bacterium]|nr:AAA family ATPase [Lachnospiraceae bacterium]